MIRLTKTTKDYFKKHVDYNSFVHVIGGMGIGILIASPIADPHPVRWGVTLLAIAVLGHLYPLMTEK